MKKVSKIVGWALMLLGLFACAITTGAGTEPISLTLQQGWSGTFPVAELDRLPEQQRGNGVGYLNDATTFAHVWQAFKPGEDVPMVDFSVDLVIFSRNVKFFNRTSILQVVLTQGRAEILAMETMSAMPIKDRLAMAMAVVPREGIISIKLPPDGAIPVE